MFAAQPGGRLGRREPEARPRAHFNLKLDRDCSEPLKTTSHGSDPRITVLNQGASGSIRNQNQGRGYQGSLSGPAGPPADRKSPARRHRDPDSRSRPNRETGIPCFPILAESGFGKQGIPVSRFWPGPNRESGIPSPIPGEIGNRGTRNGNWGFGPLAHGTCHEPLAAAADVRWRPKISVFEDQRQHLAPGSCLVLTWDEYSRFPDFRPNRESGPGDSLIPDSSRIGNLNRGFPPRFPAGIPDSRPKLPPNRESGERELGISGSAAGTGYPGYLTATDSDS